MPIKTPYKFVFIRYGLSGGLAMMKFLEKCGINEINYIDSFNNKQELDKQFCLYFDYLWQNEIQQVRKPIYTLNDNEKILILTRDPISRLKTMINHGYFLREEQRHETTFSIYDDPYHIVNRMGFHNEVYVIASITPYITNKLLEHWAFSCVFSYYSNISSMPRNAHITYLDMQEIMPNTAFQTMTRLAHEFGFSPPKYEEKEFYEEIRWGVISIILPLQCVVELQCKKKVEIQVTAKYEEDKHQIIINSLLFDSPHPLLEKVVFSMNTQDLQLLQNDEEALLQIKEYMPRFLHELQKRTDYLQRNKKSENDVLEIFRGDRDLSQKFKKMLDLELVHIKAHRPDIVASWKYYQEFERICKEEFCLKSDESINTQRA